MPRQRREPRYTWPKGQQSAVVLSFDVDAESAFIFREPDKAGRSLADLEERRFGPRVGVDVGCEFQYMDNPDGGLEVWLGELHKDR